MGINLNGLNSDANLGRKDSMTEFVVYDLAGEMESDSAEVKKSYNLTLIHLENSIMQLQKRWAHYSFLKLFIDKFFQGSFVHSIYSSRARSVCLFFSLEERFSIRLDNHNPSYGTCKFNRYSFITVTFFWREACIDHDCQRLTR